MEAGKHHHMICGKLGVDRTLLLMLLRREQDFGMRKDGVVQKIRKSEHITAMILRIEEDNKKIIMIQGRKYGSHTETMMTVTGKGGHTITTVPEKLKGGRIIIPDLRRTDGGRMITMLHGVA